MRLERPYENEEVGPGLIVSHPMTMVCWLSSPGSGIFGANPNTTGREACYAKFVGRLLRHRLHAAHRKLLQRNAVFASSAFASVSLRSISIAYPELPATLSHASLCCACPQMTVLLNPGTTWDSVGTITVWCEEFFADFGHLDLKALLAEKQAQSPSPAPEPAAAPPAAAPGASTDEGAVAMDGSGLPMRPSPLSGVSDLANCLELMPGYFNLHWEVRMHT